MLFFLFVWWEAWPALAEEQVLRLTDKREYLVGKKMSLFVDESKTMSIEDILKQTHSFVPAEQDVPYGGINRKVYWLKIVIENASDTPTDWLLWLNHNQLNYVDFFTKEDSAATWRKTSMGKLLPFELREYPHSTFVKKLNFTAQSKQTIFIRVTSERVKLFPLYVIKQQEFIDNSKTETIFYGLYFGVLLGLFLYNAFLTFSLKDWAYFYYTASILVTFFIFGLTSGKINEYFLSAYPAIQRQFLEFCSCFLIVVPLTFTQVFLELKRINPFLNKVFNGMKIAAFCVMPFILFSTKFLVETQHVYYAILSIQTPLLLYAGISSWRRGMTYAGYYTLAWIGYIVGGTLNLQRDMGGLPYSFWTTHGAEIGSALETVLLSLALSSRYQAFKKEKEKADREALKLQGEANQVLEQKVKERTYELSETNQELLQINEELASALDTVNLQKDEIEHQKEQIMSSINYAKRIQDAILPTSNEMRHVLGQFFVFFKPRNVVSGDFFYCQVHKGQVLLAAVDCTGHGVPGAFMSLVANDLLNDIILARHFTQPSLILQELHIGIRKTLRQEESHNHDGLDVVLLSFAQEKHPTQVQFAGAKNPLYYVQNNELLVIKGDKMPVGGEQREQIRVFQNHTIDIHTQTTFYLSSDGYPDQFGGPQRRKFLTKNFKDLLLEASALSFDNQQELLEKRLLAWQGEGHEVQTDDILVIGFQLNPHT
ncbi:MAG: hypothetical protein EAZ57_03560 [Cytophagales bacterium]|nr:MAG: hypothetical protein EAZ57_03560 [Cytophagales bacterium]